VEAGINPPFCQRGVGLRWPQHGHNSPLAADHGDALGHECHGTNIRPLTQIEENRS